MKFLFLSSVSLAATLFAVGAHAQIFGPWSEAEPIESVSGHGRLPDSRSPLEQLVHRVGPRRR